MGVTNYYSVEGEIQAERAGTGARTDYLRDALGSVTGTSDSSGTVVNTYRNKPYGTQLAKTGVGTNPKILWLNLRITSSLYDIVRKRSEAVVTRQYLPTTATFIQVPRISSRHSCSPYRLYMFELFIGDFKQLKPRDDIDGQYTCDPNHPSKPPLNLNKDCDKPCTQAHEDSHWNYNTPCCKKYAQCLKQAGGSREKRRHCDDLWFEWYDLNAANQNEDECEAYKAGLDCRKKMADNRLCYGTQRIDICLPPGILLVPDKCCQKLFNAIKNDESKITVYCGSNRRKVPCPF